MSDNTKISWADATWNPVVGCRHISPGCNNCYAEKMAIRLAAMHHEMYEATTKPSGWNGNVAHGNLSLKNWKRPRRIFVCSMGDLFHESVPRGVLSHISGTFVDNPHHQFLVLTKRANRMRVFFNDVPPPPNVWAGVTCENQDCAEKRIPDLLKTPAAVRWISIEPMLEKMDLETLGWCCLDWVVVGCESGPNRRPCSPEWVRGVLQNCKDREIPCFVKQLNINGKVSRNPEEWPEDLRVREYPEVAK